MKITPMTICVIYIYMDRLDIEIEYKNEMLIPNTKKKRVPKKKKQIEKKVRPLDGKIKWIIILSPEKYKQYYI